MAQTRKNRRSRGTTRKATRKSSAATARAIAVSKPLTQKINRVISRRQETKYVVQSPYNDIQPGPTNLSTFIFFSQAVTSTNELYMLLPQVNQGDDDHERIGKSIQPVKLTTKVNMAVGGVGSISIYADVYILTSKTIKDFRLCNQVLTAELLNKGDGTNVPYDGTSYNSMLPVNTDEFTVIKHKRVKLTKQVGDPNTQVSGGVAGTVSESRHFASFSVNVPCPKALTYATAGDNTPTNFFPFMLIGWHATDTLGQSITNLLPLGVQASSHLWYKDA